MKNKEQVVRIASSYVNTTATLIRARLQVAVTEYHRGDHAISLAELDKVRSEIDALSEYLTDNPAKG